MINHYRCLLLNLDGPAPATLDGEEYVPPDFRSVVLTTPLMAVRAALFGSMPDRRMLLYRTRQLLACVHAGPLAGAVTGPDPRLTYLPLARGGFELAGGLAATPIGHSTPLTVVGTPPAERDGRTAYAWTVAIGAGPTATVQPSTGRAVTTPISFAGGLAAPVAVPGSALSVLIPQAAAGTSWLVTWLANPSADLSAVATRIASAGDAALLALFGGPTAAEPYRSWGNLWASRRPLPDRLAAATSALVYRADAIRTGAT